MSKFQAIIEAQKQNRTTLTELESKQVLYEFGLPVTDIRLASSEEEAVFVSRQIGFPVVLKISSPDISHKSDVGGVRIGLKNETEITEAYQEIISSARKFSPGSRIQGVSVQSMARPGLEVILGMTRDPQFGPVIMFGLGGIWVGVLKDVSFRLIPLSRWDAGAMIREIRGFSLLQGYRNTEPANISLLQDLLLKISDFIQQTPEIREMDLNPVFVYSDSVLIVDARIVLE